MTLAPDNSLFWSHDTQHYDAQQKDTQHNGAVLLC
jgi:hypothetical protein